MAEAKEKEEKDALAQEGTDLQEPANELDLVEETGETDTGERDQESGPKRESKGLIGHIFRHKLILISVLVSILIITGLWLKFGPDLLKSLGKDRDLASLTDIVEGNLREEILAPFFIPTLSGASRGAARIDLSVVWERLAAVRFKKKELQIRDHLYRHALALAKETEDLNSKVSLLEAGMSRIFRESLGVKNLVVRIKEIHYF
ncbi:MAG: hypothetical protein JRC68_06145 [Deltaproteobacteria bacterium]|nr:hypothetical protein [Deltaproteobacteria bacterium]